MFCPHCNNKIPDGSNICPLCYANLAGVKPQAEPRASGEERRLSIPPSGPPGAIFIMKKVKIVMPNTTGIAWSNRFLTYFPMEPPYLVIAYTAGRNRSALHSRK